MTTQNITPLLLTLILTTPATAEPPNNPLHKTPNKKLEKLKTETNRLTLQHIQETEKHKLELTRLQQERDRVALENELQAERSRQELARLTAEKDRLLLENELQNANQIKALADLNAEKMRLELENALNEQKQKQTTTDLNNQTLQLATQNTLQAEKNREYELNIQLETTKLNYELAKVEFERSKNNLKIAELDEKITERDKRQEWEKQVNKPQEYPQEPYQNGHLSISDRRIDLNAPIIPTTAKYIIDRIQYYNNKDPQLPIFLVIENCAGGSVVEGSKIVNAIQTSRAPVHVVVKSLAASMAAVITALADRSYAYPNAIIVHHQIWGGSFGNITQQNEQLRVMEEWTKRLLQPVAAKMGMTTEDMIKQMYSNNSDGNWFEFAQKAAELKWVDTVVERIHETSLIRLPDEEETPEAGIQLTFALPEKIDPQGNRYIQLPHLTLPDVYFLYNPQQYYRY